MFTEHIPRQPRRSPALIARYASAARVSINFLMEKPDIGIWSYILARRTRRYRTYLPEHSGRCARCEVSGGW